MHGLTFSSTVDWVVGVLLLGVTIAGLVELLGRAREAALGAFAHQDLPFEKLLEELAPPRDLAHTPVFQVYLNVLNFPGSTQRTGELTMELAGGGGEVASKFDMTLYVLDEDGHLAIDWVHNADLFDPARMAAMAEQLAAVLRQAVADPERPAEGYDLVTASALAVLPDPGLPLDAGWRWAAHERFAELAAAAPERLAVVDPSVSWTYGELDARSARLAVELGGLGVGRGDLVALWAHRSAPLVEGLVGILRAGAGFVMLDPAYPASRVVTMLSLSQPSALLVVPAAGELPDEVAAWLSEQRCPIVALDEEEGMGAAAAPASTVDRDDVAYVAFTSGSTGTPKGILGRHGSLSHFIPWQAERFGFGPEDRFSLLSGLAHDPLHRDVLTPLQVGGAIAIPDPERSGEPGYLARWLGEVGVTVAHLTPAMGQVIAETGGAPVEVPSLRWAFLVGDVLTRRDVARLEALAPRLTCVNYYGSTETQRAVGHHVAHRGESGAGGAGREVLPLGRGIEDVQILVLTPGDHLAGIGELGELAIRSPHLALGYQGEPALTAQRFGPNPLARVADAADRIYRTGDLGRYLPSGEAVFAGRADLQVKIRGFRIEPGEIEAALGRHPAVLEAVVVARQDGGGDKRLVAYVVPRQLEVWIGAGTDLAAGLRAFLRGLLPDYMVPSAFVELAALPLTPNKKVDRRALPAPEAVADTGDRVAPRTVVEELLADIWAEVLKVERVGVHDDFFALGGHSLLATQVANRVYRMLDVTLPLRTLFQSPTLEGLAATVENLLLAEDEVPVAEAVESMV